MVEILQNSKVKPYPGVSIAFAFYFYHSKAVLYRVLLNAIFRNATKVHLSFVITVSMNHQKFPALNDDSSQGSMRSTLFESSLIADLIIV